MGTDLLNVAREYVASKASEGVLTISPVGLARELKVDEWTATRLLARLQREEHLVKVGGFVYCESCGEATRLSGGTIETIQTSAIALVGEPCGYCGSEFPRIDRIEVRLSFFCLPAAKAAGTVRAGRSDPPATSSPINVAQLGKLTETGDVYLSIANEKGSVAVNSQVGNKAGGDLAGGGITKAGRDLQVNDPRSETKAPPVPPIFKNPTVLAAAITAAGVIIAAIFANWSAVSKKAAEPPSGSDPKPAAVP